MTNRIIAVSSLGLICILGFLNATPDDFPVLKGPYLGQDPPGDTPMIFAPGIVSTGFNEHIASFTPDGKELFFRMLGAPHGATLFMQEHDKGWTKPEIASFSNKYDVAGVLSPDGNKFIFCTGMPLDGRGEPNRRWETWIVERDDSGWNQPKNLDHLAGLYPSVSPSGNIYFYSDRLDGMGEADIYVSKFADGRYGEPENLGRAVNTEFYDNDPFIAPDESYLVFQSNRPGGYGKGDLYVSFKNQDGSWTSAQNLGKEINSAEGDGCPVVSPDAKYLFFSSLRKVNPKNYSETPLTFEEKTKMLTSPGYGSEDIYWVDSKVIEELRPKP